MDVVRQEYFRSVSWEIPSSSMGKRMEDFIDTRLNSHCSSFPRRGILFLICAGYNAYEYYQEKNLQK